MLAEKSKLLLSIVIVSFNTAKLAKACLESVSKEIETSQILKKRTEIIVVDNASSDDSVNVILSLSKHRHSPFDKLRVTANKTNLGFAKANNQAIRQAWGQYILLLNSDTIVHPGALENLVKALEKTDRRLGILAASLKNSDGSYQPQGGTLPSLLSVLTQWWSLDDLPVIGKLLPCFQKRHQETIAQNTGDLPVAIGWVGGTAVCIKKVVFDQVGLLDEKIFMYGEDSEFCLRAAKASFGRAILPSAQVTHLGSQSSNPDNAKRGEVESLFYIFKKYLPSWQTSFLSIIIICGCALRFYIFKLQNKPKLASFYHQLALDLLAHRRLFKV